MIRERETKIYYYDPKEDLEEADLVFEDFVEADINFNSFRAETIVKRLSTELKPEMEAMVANGFHKILLAEETEWYVVAVQPIPGALRIRLRHYGAQIVGDYGKDEVDKDMTAERKAECKRVKEILNGCDADLVLSWKKAEPKDTNIWLRLTAESGENVSFEVDEDETTIEVREGLFDDSIEYILTWDNEEHTRIKSRRTHTFSL